MSRSHVSSRDATAPSRFCLGPEVSHVAPNLTGASRRIRREETPVGCLGGAACMGWARGPRARVGTARGPANPLLTWPVVCSHGAPVRASGRSLRRPLAALGFAAMPRVGSGAVWATRVKFGGRPVDGAPRSDIGRLLRERPSGAGNSRAPTARVRHERQPPAFALGAIGVGEFVSHHLDGAQPRERVGVVAVGGSLVGPCQRLCHRPFVSGCRVTDVCASRVHRVTARAQRSWQPSRRPGNRPRLVPACDAPAGCHSWVWWAGRSRYGHTPAAAPTSAHVGF